MLNQKTNQRELAYIVKVTETKDLEGYDKVYYVRILGWWCVAPRDIKKDDLVIYFEIDSLLPEEDTRFAFMAKRKFRIKPIKMCKVLSQGLVLPLRDFPECSKMKEGDFVTDLLKVKLYESEPGPKPVKDKVSAFTKAQNRHKKFFSFPPVKFLMRFSWFRSLMKRVFVPKKDTYKWPTWLPKTNQERIQNVPQVLQDKSSKWILTEKVDGMSTSAWIDEKGVFGIGSHNVVVFSDRNPDSKTKCESSTSTPSNVWCEEAEHYHLFTQLKKIKEEYGLKAVAIQGETYGDGIQKRTYGLKGRKHDFVVFHILFNGERISMQHLVDLCERYPLPHVHVYDWGYTLPDTVESLIEEVNKRKSAIDGRMIEGFVLYSQDGLTSYKCVSPDFLLKYHG